MEGGKLAVAISIAASRAAATRLRVKASISTEDGICPFLLYGYAQVSHPGSPTWLEAGGRAGFTARLAEVRAAIPLPGVDEIMGEMAWSECRLWSGREPRWGNR